MHNTHFRVEWSLYTGPSVQCVPWVVFIYRFQCTSTTTVCPLGGLYNIQVRAHIHCTSTTTVCHFMIHKCCLLSAHTIQLQLTSLVCCSFTSLTLLVSSRETDMMPSRADVVVSSSLCSVSFLHWSSFVVFVSNVLEAFNTESSSFSFLKQYGK